MLFSTNMQYFLKTVECKSFSKAAEELFISQSAVSKSVRMLEEKLKCSLIDRTYRKVTLTKQGEIVFKYAKEMEKYFNEKRTEMLNELEKSENYIRFGLPPTAGSIFFHSAIYDFKKNFKDVDLEIFDLTSNFIVEKLLKNELDMGIAITPFDDERFCIHKVFKSEAILVVSDRHKFSKYKNIEFSKLKDEKFLQVKQDFMFYNVFVSKCKKAGFTPKIVFESNQWDLIIEMVASGQGITILPKPLIDKYSGENIRKIHLVNPEFEWGLDLIYLKSKILTRPMEEFLKICLGK